MPEHTQRNTILVLVLLVIAFIALMVKVWKPSSPDATVYGYETSYWYGLAVGVNVVLIANVSHALYNMRKK